jgi:hypothetical protein
MGKGLRCVFQLHVVRGFQCCQREGVWLTGDEMPDGAQVYVNKELPLLDLPSLSTVGASLDVTSTAKMTEISLPMLTSITLSLGVGANPLVSSLYLANLNSIGSIIQVSRGLVRMK